MELQGTWTKDEEGYMHFETAQLQRLYELVTDDYYAAYNGFLDELGDEDDAFYKAREAGYEMITNDKLINGETEFDTTFHTPAYVADIWYMQDSRTGKKVFDKGFIRILKK